MVEKTEVSRQDFYDACKEIAEKYPRRKNPLGKIKIMTGTITGCRYTLERRSCFIGQVLKEKYGATKVQLAEGHGAGTVMTGFNKDLSFPYTFSDHACRLANFIQNEADQRPLRTWKETWNSPTLKWAFRGLQ